MGQGIRFLEREGDENMTQTKTRSAPGMSQQRVLEAVTARPGLHGWEYALALNLTKGAVTAASQRLVEQGLITKTGKTAQTRLYPTGADIPAEAPAQPRKRSARKRPARKRPAVTAPKTNAPNGVVNVELLRALGIQPVSATLVGDDVLVVGGEVYRIEKKTKIGASIRG